MASPSAVMTMLLDKISEKYGQAMPDADSQADPAELRALVDECLAKLGDDDEEEPEKFTDDEPPAGPAPIADQTAATPDSHAVEKLLADAQTQGAQYLANLATKAITRYVRGGGSRLFSPAELKGLQNECAKSLAPADLLGRSRVRLRGEQAGSGVRMFADTPTNFTKVPSVPLQPPLSSLEYFKSLVPTLNVEPLTWLPGIEQQAFTMAVATEQQLLEKVQKEIAGRIASGEYGWGPQAIQDLLESAGVAPANPQYCFLPGTLVEGDVVAISKANYDGPAVEIETDDGRALRVSINHPVLTTSGWKVAGDIDEGDDLVCYGNPVESLGAGRSAGNRREFSESTTSNSSQKADAFPGVRPPSQGRAIDNQDVPARVEDVFESLLGQCGTILDAQRPIRALDFHGDAVFMDGKIDRIRANWMLQCVADPQSGERSVEIGFMFGDISASPLASMSSSLLCPTGDASGDSSLATCELGKDTILLSSGSGCPENLMRIGSASQLDPSIFKACFKTPGGDVQLACNLVESLSGLVSVNSVSKVKRMWWTGHVYDLQTVHGFIISQGIVTSNCEMVFRTNVKDALAKGTHEELNDPEVLPNFPVWKYVAAGGPKGDGRNRPTHLAKHGNYYPSTVPFTKVRGEGPEDACNDRCDFIPIDRWEWDELQARGARVTAV